MKLTNQEIITTYKALDSLGNKDLPILTTYTVINNLEKLYDAYHTYDLARQKVKNDDELLELLNIEVEVDLELIDKQVLVDKDISLTPIQLVGLKRLING